MKPYEVVPGSNVVETIQNYVTTLKHVKVYAIKKRKTTTYIIQRFQFHTKGWQVVSAMVALSQV